LTAYEKSPSPYLTPPPPDPPLPFLANYRLATMHFVTDDDSDEENVNSY